MSTTSLPSYIAPSLTTPPYSAEPHEHELRIVPADCLRPKACGNFVKTSKDGDARLQLNAQEDNIDLPVYGRQGCVEGTIELSKTEHVASVEAKIEGRLRLDEIAEGGTTSARLCLNTVTLWTRDDRHSVCPSSFSFSLCLPATFPYGDKTYLLPPTFGVKLSGLPGFTASIDYSVSITIAKPHYVPLVKSNVLGIPSRVHTVTTPFIYYPRSRPAAPIPAPLSPAQNGFTGTHEWRPYEWNIRSKTSGLSDITTILYVPVSRTFCMAQPIPFHLTFKSSALSLASFLPLAPTPGYMSGKQATRIELMRQSTVDVRNTVAAGAKTDMWRVDCIGRASFKHSGNGPTWISYSGELIVQEAVKVTGFRAAGLNVKDLILFSMMPPDPLRSPFTDVRQTVPVRLTTDPWLNSRYMT